jgi:hypothetical protein
MARLGRAGGDGIWWCWLQQQGREGRLGLAKRGGDAAAAAIAGGHAGERSIGEKEGCGFIGARRPEI